MKNRLLILIILALPLLLAGIALLRLARIPLQKKEKVAVTIFPLYDFVRNIAGDEVEVALVLAPGASPHTYDPKPQEVKKLAGSRAVFAIGHGLDNWSFKLAENSGVNEVIAVDRNVKLFPFEHQHGEVGHEEHEDEGVDGMDPHYWLSVPNAIAICRQLEVDLVRLFPEKEEIFEANFLNYEKKLQSLGEEIDSELGELGNPNIATFHSAWNYFARDHKMNVIATFEEFPGEEPTALYLAEFEEKVKANNVKVIFGEPQFSTKSLEPIAKDLGVTISVLDPMGGVSGRESFEELMRYNVNQIIKALR